MLKEIKISKTKSNCLKTCLETLRKSVSQSALPFKKLNIVWKLRVLSSIFILSIVILSIISLNSVISANQASKTINRVNIASMKILYEIKELALKNEIEMNLVLKGSDNMQMFSYKSDRIYKNESRILELIGRLPLPSDHKESDILEKFLDIRNSYSKVIERTLEYVSSKDMQSANSYYNTNQTFLNSYIALLNQLSDNSIAKSESVQLESESNGVFSFWLSVAAISVSVLASSIVAWVISKSITKPIDEANQQLKFLSEKDLTQNILEKYISNENEIGTISNSIIKTQNSFKLILADIYEKVARSNHKTKEINDFANILNANISDILDNSICLSRSIYETTESTHQINFQSKETERAILFISKKSEESKKVSSKILEKSKDILEGAILSKKQVESIYEISRKRLKIAIESEDFDELSRSSLQIIDMFGTKVLSDYEKLMAMNHGHRNDAAYIEQISRELSLIAKDVYESIHSINLKIAHMADASEDGAKSTIIIKERVSSVNKLSRKVVENMTDMTKDFSNLMKVVNSFKIV